jgi:hypothetical protein
MLNLRSVTTLAVALVLAAVSYGQPIFGPVLPVITPSQYLSGYVDAGARWMLEKQGHLSYNGYWDSNGHATITDGFTRGAISWNATVNVGVGSTSQNYSFAYQLEVQNLGNGEAIVVLNWTKTVSNGSSTGGIVSVHRIKRSSGSIYPVASGTGGRNGLSSNSPSGSGAGGSYHDFSADYQYGYMGSNGVYYVVAGTTRGRVWQPSYIRQMMDKLAW